MSTQNLIYSNANPNRDNPINTEESSPPRPHRVQNQDSVAETIPCLSSSTGSSPGTAVANFLWNSYGLKLRDEWLNLCVSEFNVATKKNLIYERFLFSDMNLSCGGDGVLPEKLPTMKGATLPGPFLLQVNETVNISGHPKDRFKERCLKLSMTDGVRSVYGVEHRPIENLRVSAPAGFKVIIRNVNVGNGFLLLVPEGLDVLGGMVEDLEAERKKLVDETNEPLWVKRMRALSTNGAQKTSDVGGSANGVGLQDAMPSGSCIQGTPYAPSHNAVPYTYLKHLLSDWTEKKNHVPSIQTRIKCVLTAITRFDYEKVTKYELFVSVDDGSTSSDVCIHHDAVFREVGYTPEQVSAALYSPGKDDVDGKIWKAMMDFVQVLSDFRGTLLVEMNRKSAVPVALEMINETATFDNSWVMEPEHYMKGGSYVCS
ncbi:hypothetical protein MKX03_005527 [Papaver bracteatum]|nr:hypothetical protein MKX03_005527 [Papaver bracteatum]